MTDLLTEVNQASPAAPHSVDQTGIRRGLLEDLALKILFLNGEMNLIELSNHLCLSLGVVEEIFQFFRKERLCEVKGMSGGTHRIACSQEGRARASDLLSLNQYSGAAPVSLPDYVARVKQQSIKATGIRPEHLEEALQQLVIGDDMMLRLGTAVVSGASMFLYGPSGTGKTSIATRVSAVYSDHVWVPYAVEVDNQIITVFDPGVHRRRQDSDIQESDRRWVLCHRPCVITGGELTAEMLELQFNPVSRYYAAPLQMKANNGTFVIDDFGRQRMRPQELLNRWMTALDQRIEYLGLPGGRKFEIPFDVLVVFSTNLSPSQLGDDAFMRRIPNKIKVDFANREQFEKIFRREAEEVRGLSVDDETIGFLVDHLTHEIRVPLAHCYARDLLDQIFWAARYLNAKPEFNKELAKWACSNYFFFGTAMGSEPPK